MLLFFNTTPPCAPSPSPVEFSDGPFMTARQAKEIERMKRAIDTPEAVAGLERAEEADRQRVKRCVCVCVLEGRLFVHRP